MNIRFPGLTIADLALAAELEDSLLLEVEGTGESKKATLGSIVAKISANFHSRNEVNLLLAEKLNKNGKVEDSEKLDGQTKLELFEEIELLTVAGADMLGGKSASHFATKAEHQELVTSVEGILLLLQDLFTSLDNGDITP